MIENRFYSGEDSFRLNQRIDRTLFRSSSDSRPKVVFDKNLRRTNFSFDDRPQTVRKQKPPNPWATTLSSRPKSTIYKDDTPSLVFSTQQNGFRTENRPSIVLNISNQEFPFNIQNPHRTNNWTNKKNFFRPFSSPQIRNLIGQNYPKSPPRTKLQENLSFVPEDPCSKTISRANSRLSSRSNFSAVKEFNPTEQTSRKRKMSTTPNPLQSLYEPTPIKDVPELSQNNILNMLNQIPDLKGRRFNIQYAPSSSANQNQSIPFYGGPSAGQVTDPVVIDRLPSSIIQHVRTSNDPAMKAALEAAIQQENTGSPLRNQPAAILNHSAQANNRVQQCHDSSSDESSTDDCSSEYSSSSDEEIYPDVRGSQFIQGFDGQNRF